MKLQRDPQFWRTLTLPRRLNTQIPLQSLRALCDTFKVTVKEQTITALQESLTEPFTFEEFQRGIARLTKDKAPGPSMVTSNMLKALPEEVLKRMYDLMNELWSRKEIPLWWKDHVLTPAPKSELVDHLDQMRPIGLFEITRKVWTAMVVRRIYSIWHHHKVLRLWYLGCLIR